ncbi:fimbrial protein [Candidatus Symbiopectobacterium sp. 'North America']|uniref:fimbrial protein n=1 Tax=Candidatus Symbiopectobacterium sp. 'North America' TaxID=2794574 RepID=UPI0018CAF799|nr:fimbrial protein [Candidatus Symbiopectobacterium sp. 'North America']MBG6246620.1 fimbrial protein [Candidatus Symbiopectobacterium sp. 'North America']
MYRILLSLVLAALGLFSQTALAWDCTTVTPSTTVSPQNLTISRDLPVGAVIGTQIVTPTINAFSCWNSDEGIINNQTLGVKASGTFDSMLNGRRVYKTNVDGIGYAISGSTTACAGENAAVTGSNTMFGNSNTATLFQNTSGIISPMLNGSVTVTFYKTAPETGSGTIAAQTVGALVLLSNSVLWQSPEASVNINAFTITTPACKLTTASIAVDMKDVDKKEFNGKGSTPEDAYTQSFNLPMTCNAGTQVSVKMEGDIYDAPRGVFNTTSGNNVATGVGIQLLYNNQPMALGSDVTIGTSSAGGGFTVSLKARYYQTGDRITTGTANGMLSFTMTYQ